MVTSAVAEPVAPAATSLDPVIAPGITAPILGRRERRVAETRAALAKAARELFEERGYSETTIDQIAERADVATRTLFRYFPTKEALLFSSFDEWRQALLVALEARPLDEPPLCSVAHALADVVVVADQLRPQIERAMRLAQEHEAVAAYKRGVHKEESVMAIAQFIAARLGVSVDDDPRPEAWAGMMLSGFGTAMRHCNGRELSPATTAMETLATLMAESADALCGAAKTLRERSAN